MAEVRLTTRDELKPVPLADLFRKVRFRFLAFLMSEHFNALPGALLPVPCYFLTVNCARRRRGANSIFNNFLPDLNKTSVATV